MFDIQCGGRISNLAGKAARLLGAVAAVGLVATAAEADPVNLIENGNFSDTTAYTANGTGTEISNSNLADWTVSSCVVNCDPSHPNNLFMFLAPSNVGTNGVYNGNQGGTINFWSSPGAVPGGGNAITSDAATESGAIFQAVKGLTVGDTYQLSFYQATMQATNQAEPFTARWAVGFGDSPTQFSTVMSNPGGTSTPWNLDTMTFTADATSEFLGFLATTVGGDEPPFLLLGDVSLTDVTSVPEPATFALALVGIAGVVVARRRRAAA